MILIRYLVNSLTFELNGAICREVLIPLYKISIKNIRVIPDVAVVGSGNF